MAEIENKAESGSIWREISLFALVFALIGVSPIVEYAKQFIAQGTLYKTICYFTITGSLHGIPMWFYYRKIIPLLFEKKYLLFIISVLFFLIGYDLYIRIIVDWLLSNLPFLPEGVQNFASRAFETHKTRWIRLSVSNTVTNLITVAAYAYFRRSGKHEQEIIELKTTHLEMELDYLKTQINPHFFFNTLNNIYSLALDRSEATAPVVSRLSDLMQYVMQDSGKSKVPLSQEIGFIKNYVDIEQIRFSDNIAVSFSIEGESKDLVIEPLLLIPFIENAFKHGVREELENGFIHILIRISEKNFTLKAENSIADTTIASETGLGLANVRKRLSLLYPEKHILDAHKYGNIYKVTLEIQLD